MAVAANIVQAAIPIAAALIRKHEAFRAEPYDDFDGKPLSSKGGVAKGTATVGYGFTEAMRKGITKRSLTKAEAERIMIEEIARNYGPVVFRAISNKKVSPAQVAALISVCWNVGPSVASSAIVKSVNAGDIRGAATALKSYKITSKGKTIKGLVNRRAAEAATLLGSSSSTAASTAASTGQSGVVYQPGGWGMIQSAPPFKFGWQEALVFGGLALAVGSVVFWKQRHAR
jgi:GH24 family phage-related lysozyme (muramidase)